ncbi:MAG: hydratase [Spirochaetaceae bacterium]|jgi:aconitate hydratase|nr:hydratase [Spirochaetaceae bacterium]
MVEVLENGVYLFNGREVVGDTPENAEPLRRRLSAALSPAAGLTAEELARRGAMAYGILAAHNAGSGEPGTVEPLRLRFDALASHDITFVNIIQTVKVSGLTQFPVPYILTNCHNSLCAVGGTINEDDHLFGLSAARRFGGIYVPPHLAVIHSYVREEAAGCGRMILGSDSHTRYGALGTLGVGEGGGELVKQLLRQTYDIPYPRVIAVYLTGKPRNGVGPQDVALALIGAVFKSGFVKNAVLEFVGEGIAGLSADYRCGIDVMTTETTCWSSIWETDETVREYLELHGRGGDYRRLSPGPVARYDGLIRLDLSTVKPMIALPFHPSNVYEIDALLENAGDILRQTELDGAALIGKSGTGFTLTDRIEGKGLIRVDQGIIAGCAGGAYENIMAAAAILEKGRGDASARVAPDGRLGDVRTSAVTDFSLSVYPGSQPVMLELVKNGTLGRLIAAGIVVRTAFCGPCFGAGDVPANNGFSIRHTTRNFPNREGSRPGNGQISSVALCDARSIAATARNGGYLCSAESPDVPEGIPPYRYDNSPYKKRVYNGVGRPQKDRALRYGPNITDWPEFEKPGEQLLVKIVSFITDPVTTTDEIIPSGETSSYRSNPVGLAEFTLSRKDPAYVERAKQVRQAEEARRRRFGGGAAESGPANSAVSAGTAESKPAVADIPPDPAELFPELTAVFARIGDIQGSSPDRAELRIGSAIYAVKPGDGSAREQAASCQRVLGGLANFASEYATKRYRSNLINWGIIPFIVDGPPPFANGDYVFFPRIRRDIEGDGPVSAYVIGSGGILPCTFRSPELSPGERALILEGCLINYNRLGISL